MSELDPQGVTVESCGDAIEAAVSVSRNNVGRRREGGSPLSRNPAKKMVRPERFELPTFGFVVRRSIQLS